MKRGVKIWILLTFILLAGFGMAEYSIADATEMNAEEVNAICVNTARVNEAEADATKTDEGDLKMPDCIRSGKDALGILDKEEREVPIELPVADEEENTNFSAHLSSETGDLEVSLYVVDDSYTSYISLPLDYPQSYNISGHTYEIVSGDSITVENNIVRPKKTRMYYNQLPSGYWVGSSSPTGAEGEVIKIEYIYGDSILRLDGTTTITFHVVNYPKMYSENVMDTYLAENVTSDMSEYGIAELCCKFVANYDYGADFTSYTGMIVSGAGDCWASTSTLLYMLKKQGITCDSRDASGDVGAGSGHVNVVALLDGKNYILDAGYEGTAPRYYSMSEYSTTFAYTNLTSDTIEITGFINLENLTEIRIPEMIDGYKVVKIGAGAFSSQTEVVNVIIPNTVTSIGDKAFYHMDSLKTISIPDSVTSFGNLCFSNSGLTELSFSANVEELASNCFLYCNCLKVIEMDENNPYYSARDGVLFNKDQTELLCFPAGRWEKSYSVPEGVQILAGLSFTYARLEKMTLPDSLKLIKMNAFYGTAVSSPLVIPDGVETIESGAFENTNIMKVVLPDGMERIEDYTFYRSNIRAVALPKNLTYVGEGAFAGCFFMSYHSIPKSVKEIGSHAFDLEYGWSSMGDSSSEKKYSKYIVFDKDCNVTIGEEAFTGVMLGVEEGSSMYQYVQENSLPYTLVVDGVLQLEKTDTALENGVKCITLSWKGNLYGDAGFIGGQQGEYTVSAKPLNDEIFYEVYRRKNSERNYVKVGSIAGETSWTDRNVQHNMEYSYQVHTRVNGVTFSSAIENMRYLDAPVLNGVYLSRPSPKNVDITVAWQTVSGADAYRVYRRKAGADNWEGCVIVDASSAATMTKVIRLSAEYSYEIWVTANKGNYESAPSQIMKPVSKTKMTISPAAAEKNTKWKDASGNTYVVTNAGANKTAAYAKAGNTSAASVIIPATVRISGDTYKVTSIQAKAFKGNTKLKKVTIGKNVEMIGKKAFYGCKNLRNITIQTTKLKKKTVGAKAFKNISSKAVIKAPKKKKAVYKILLKARGVGNKAKFK